MISTVFAKSSIEWNFSGWSKDQLKYEFSDKRATGHFQEVPEFTKHYVSFKNGNFFQVNNALRGFIKHNVTFEAVMRVTERSKDVGGIFSFGDTASMEGLFLGYSGQSKQYFHVSFSGSSPLKISQKRYPVRTGEWVHIIAKCSRKRAEFYINGQLLKRVNLEKHKIIYPSHKIITIGSYYSTNKESLYPVTADFHMFKIYNFPLNTDEIQKRIQWGKKLIATEFPKAKPIPKENQGKKAEVNTFSKKVIFRILAILFFVLGTFFAILNKIVRNSQSIKKA